MAATARPVDLAAMRTASYQQRLFFDAAAPSPCFARLLTTDAAEGRYVAWLDGDPGRRGQVVVYDAKGLSDVSEPALKVPLDDADEVTALALHLDYLYVGTRTGLIKRVDI